MNEKTVYKLSKRGEVLSFNVADAWRFKRSHLDIWIDKQKKTAQTKA